MARPRIINEVVFNQVLVRWISPDDDHNSLQRRSNGTEFNWKGTAFFSGTTWNGQRFMRISVSDWATDERDIERAMESLLRNAELSAKARS